MAQPLQIQKSPRVIAGLAAQYKALGDTTRLSLIMAIAAGENGEACVCDLTPDSGLSQSTVSHHLKILVEAGLLSRTQRGKWAFYEVTGQAKKLIK
ncbi:MAG: winged helix-turn-helix transcriptional regulator [Actinobacteria bacterium]|nr:winged helix-turn-helix transcriptional regulator [Actinomycetota bacterium]